MNPKAWVAGFHAIMDGEVALLITKSAHPRWKRRTNGMLGDGNGYSNTGIADKGGCWVRTSLPDASASLLMYYTASLMLIR